MTHITTASGKRFDLLSINPHLFDLSDIAHSLARIIRFNGHQSGTWSVGLHSICCAMMVDGDANRREALLHDASEAYLCDIPTPLKSLLPDYQLLEDRIDGALRFHYELPVQMSHEVRNIDRIMFENEAYYFHRPLWVELGCPALDKAAQNLIRSHCVYQPYQTSELFFDMAGVL